MKRKFIVFIILLCICFLSSCSHEGNNVAPGNSFCAPGASENASGNGDATGSGNADDSSIVSSDDTTSVSPSSSVSRSEGRLGNASKTDDESSSADTVQSVSPENSASPVSSMQESSKTVSNESSVDTKYFARLLYSDYKSAFEKSAAMTSSNIKIAEKYSCPELGIDETSYLEVRREEENKTASYRFFNRLNGRPTLTLIYCDRDGNAYVSEAGEKFVTRAELVVIDMPRFFEVSQDNVSDAQLSISGRRSNITFSVENAEVCKGILSRMSSENHNTDGSVISNAKITFSANISPLGYLLSETMNVSFSVSNGDVKAYFEAEQCIEYTLPDMVLPPENFGLVDKKDQDDDSSSR